MENHTILLPWRSSYGGQDPKPIVVVRSPTLRCQESDMGDPCDVPDLLYSTWTERDGLDAWLLCPFHWYEIHHLHGGHEITPMSGDEHAVQLAAFARSLAVERDEAARRIAREAERLARIGVQAEADVLSRVAGRLLPGSQHDSIEPRLVAPLPTSPTTR